VIPFVRDVFLDGYAGKINLKKLWRLKWHRQFNINGPRKKASGVQPSDWPQWMRRFKDY
jgi:hypothetical protein